MHFVTRRFNRFFFLLINNIDSEMSKIIYGPFFFVKIFITKNGKNVTLKKLEKKEQ